MRILVDIDGVLCEQVPWKGPKAKDCLEAIPIQKNIDFVNEIKGYGVEIILFTARLSRFRDVTDQWLKKHKVQHDTVVFTKPWSDYTIDDRCTSFEKILEECKKWKEQ